MWNFSLSAYSFNLKQAYSKDKYLNLNENINFQEFESTVDVSIFSIFSDFFESVKDFNTIEKSQKTFKCHFNESNVGTTPDFKYFYAMIESGDYGYNATIVDTFTGEETGKIQPKEATQKKFMMYVAIPKSSPDVVVQKGLILFQNIGNYGIKTITTEHLQKFLIEKYNITFKCKTVSTKIFLERMLKRQNIQKLSMTKNHISEGIEDNQSKGYGKETKIISKLLLTESSWIELKNRFDHFMSGKFSLFEFESENYDELTVTVKVNKHQRTFNLNSLENLAIIEPIPENIRTADGLADLDLLLEHFNNTATDYLSEMNLQLK